MNIQQVIQRLENWAPLPYQENYDNAGLITGCADWECSGILCCLDSTEEVLDDAINEGCNLVIAHHPIVFGTLKKFTPKSYVEKAIIKAIKNDICIYAIHTNLDNIRSGVNAEIARRLLMDDKNLTILSPKTGQIAKLYVYVPNQHAEQLKQALFTAGAGTIGLYEECSFSTNGNGTFKPLTGSSPTIGTAGGSREEVNEVKIEVVFPSHLQHRIVAAMYKAHPYEVPAYEIILLANANQYLGSGMIGQLPHTMTELEFLHHVKSAFGLKIIKHTPFLNRPIRAVAFCGGAGSFLTKAAISSGADAYITSDIKYHEFFDAEGKTLLTDIGHWESEQFTIDLLANFLQDKFPTFAVLKTGVYTNPVNYFI
jgi:dinuclear metal center YbgI/SA1388 family protein